MGEIVKIHGTQNDARVNYSLTPELRFERDGNACGREGMHKETLGTPFTTISCNYHRVAPGEISHLTGVSF